MSATGGAGAIEQAFTRVVSGATTLIVGIFVFSEIISSLPTPPNGTVEANATNTSIAMTGDAFVLGAVALIVFVASLILSLIAGAGGGRRPR